METPKLKVEQFETADLVPYAHNAKEHDDKQIHQIAESISQFGFNDPIGVWTNGRGELEIVEGHGRVMAAMELGIDRVPIIRLDHMDDDARRAYTHVHNQTTLTSGFDEVILAAEMDELYEFDWASFGFHVRPLVEELDEATIEEPDIPDDVEEFVEDGDIWQLGRHRVMCGDSTNQQDVQSLMGGVLADMLLTDPPYNIDYTGKTSDAMKIKNDAFDSGGAFREFLVSALSSARANMKDGAPFYIWHADSERVNFQLAAEESGFTVRQTLIWNKSTFTLGRQDYQWKHEPCLYGWKDGAAHWFTPDRTLATVVGDKAPEIESLTREQAVRLLESMLSGLEVTVLDAKKPVRSDEHPTMKPVLLMARLVRNSSQPGDVVLDTFLGSGSTLLACDQLGRTCYGMELDRHYCGVVIQRWQELTGLTAERLCNVREG